MRQRCRCGQWFDLLFGWRLKDGEIGCGPCYQAEHDNVKIEKLGPLGYAVVKEPNAKTNNNDGLINAQHAPDVSVEVLPELYRKRNRRKKA